VLPNVLASAKVSKPPASAVLVVAFVPLVVLINPFMALVMAKGFPVAKALAKVIAAPAVLVSALLVNDPNCESAAP